MYNDMLISEGFGYGLEIDLKESNLEKGLLKFRGKLQEAERVNKNKRMYPYAVLDENVQRLKDIVKAKGLVGELDHPADSIVHFKEASHVFTKLWWDNQILMGEGEILNTAHGKQLRALLEAGVRIGMSSRGVGNGRVNESGILVISEGYKLITFDAVADPSTPEAYQQQVVNKRESVEYQNNFEKNKDTGIYTINKDLVIAAIGGIVSESTKKYARKQ